MNGTWKNDETWQAYLWFAREERRWQERAQDEYDDTSGTAEERMNETLESLAQLMQWHLEDESHPLASRDVDWRSIAVVFAEAIITDEE